jgi:hypothetical protein
VAARVVRVLVVPALAVVLVVLDHVAATLMALVITDASQ